MTQVRFIVDPLSMYRSGPPMMSVEGSADGEEIIVGDKNARKRDM